jgi:hypothetical protein
LLPELHLVHVTRSLLALLTVLLGAPGLRGADGPAILQLRVAEGDGAVYPAGTRATRGVTVLVTDETGRPVEGATVSFSLPAEGPGGVFASGARSEVVTTRGDGIASVWGMQWNRAVGPFDIRVTAARGPARAGTTVAQFLRQGSPQAAAEQRPPRRSGGGLGSHRLLWVALAIAGGAVAGVAARGSSSASATGTTTTAVSSSVQIGNPSITLGRP